MQPGPAPRRRQGVLSGGARRGIGTAPPSWGPTRRAAPAATGGPLGATAGGPAPRPRAGGRPAAQPPPPRGAPLRAPAGESAGNEIPPALGRGALGGTRCPRAGLAH